MCNFSNGGTAGTFNLDISSLSGSVSSVLGAGSSTSLYVLLILESELIESINEVSLLAMGFYLSAFTNRPSLPLDALFHAPFFLYPIDLIVSFLYHGDTDDFLYFP